MWTWDLPWIKPKMHVDQLSVWQNDPWVDCTNRMMLIDISYYFSPASGNQLPFYVDLHILFHILLLHVAKKQISFLPSPESNKLNTVFLPSYLGIHCCVPGIWSRDTHKNKDTVSDNCLQAGTEFLGRIQPVCQDCRQGNRLRVQQYEPLWNLDLKSSIFFTVEKIKVSLPHCLHPYSENNAHFS